MAAKSKGYRGLSSADQRAARDQRLASQADQVELAKQREMKMVANLGQFADECRWFIGNKVWLTLGYQTLIEWWADRISPVVERLGLKPGPELAQLAIEAIEEEEASLPSAQRHTKKAISAIVGIGDWKVRRRQDPRQRRTTAGADLEDRNVIDAEFTETTADNDSGDVTAAAGVSGHTAADGRESPPADGPSRETVPTHTVEGPAGDGPAPYRPVPGKPQDSPAGRPEASDTPGGTSGSAATDRPGIDSPLARGEAPLAVGAAQPSEVAATDDGPDRLSPVAPEDASRSSSGAQKLIEGQAPHPSAVPVLSPPDSGVYPDGDRVEEESRPATTDSSSTDPTSDWMHDWRALVRNASVVRWHFSEDELAEVRDDIVGLGQIFRSA